MGGKITNSLFFRAEASVLYFLQNQFSFLRRNLQQQILHRSLLYRSQRMAAKRLRPLNNSAIKRRPSFLSHHRNTTQKATFFPSNQKLITPRHRYRVNKTTRSSKRQGASLRPVTSFLRSHSVVPQTGATRSRASPDQTSLTTRTMCRGGVEDEKLSGRVRFHNEARVPQNGGSAVF